ncbi:MAG: von Willebrand factor type A domain-containing protein [Clostridia bacterium]|nr:von Willebrand factor type A domain-containing protein [Clostridia bacterium]
MKKAKIFIICIISILLSSMAFGCGAAGYGGYYKGDGYYSRTYWQSSYASGNYDYNKVIEEPFYETSEQDSSYFSLDRNTAGYSYVRRQINDKRSIAGDSVRMEELINYFDYGYPAPEGDDVVKATTYLTDCPWNEAHKLLTIGVKTKEIRSQASASNFVFLIDVSGSMSGDTRIGLVKYGANLLIDQLSDTDSVAIVTYASGVGVKLESTLLNAAGKRQAKAAVNALQAGGSTYGSGGLEMAYRIAESQRAEGVNSRIILMTDGDFNVGISDQATLKRFIIDKAKGGVYLSVLGFGMGNTRDSMLDTLARNGNGNYAYIDCRTEAEKVFTDELDGMLVTVLKDAKAGVTFTDKVKKYRLLGYDTKTITEQEFNDENKDTGEIGSNLTVTAMYELELAEDALEGDKLATVEIRYKNALENEENESVTVDVTNDDNYEARVGFAACVAEFGLVLRDSRYKGSADLSSVAGRLGQLGQYIDEDIYKKEFVYLVGLASELYPNEQ